MSVNGNYYLKLFCQIAYSKLNVIFPIYFRISPQQIIKGFLWVRSCSKSLKLKNWIQLCILTKRCNIIGKTRTCVCVCVCVCVFMYKVAHEIVQNESRNKERFLITENSQKLTRTKSLCLFPGNDGKECYQRLSRDIGLVVDWRLETLSRWKWKSRRWTDRCK